MLIALVGLDLLIGTALMAALILLEALVSIVDPRGYLPTPGL
jgi:hypothetical protein